MDTDCIHYKDTGYFSPIILDYLAGSEKLRPFYSHPPKLESFDAAIEAKQFDSEKRETLHQSLQAQYKKGGIKLKSASLTQQNVTALLDQETYTVTTGHQLNLFTGPLYFVYKIVSTIKLAKSLKEKFPEKHFVPIYWMASEDHDFEEISFFRFQGKKLKWKTKQSGAVGRMNPKELESVLAEFEDLLTPYTSNGSQLKNWFKAAYLQHDNLTDATRYLAHQLFESYGLVIVDGDDAALKAQMHDIFKADLVEEISSHKVEAQSQALGEHYKVQANPRAINLFYLTENARHRFEKVGEQYHIVDTEQVFSEAEILTELEQHPERFSPNVILRPLYQEAILPNLAYIGGGGELAYWFELKTTFEHFKIPYPILLLRNSVMWMDEKQSKYFKELGIDLKDLFQEEGLLLKNWVKKNAKVDLELKSEMEAFQELYKNLQVKSKEIDQSLDSHVGALAEKQKQSLQQLSEKLIRAERKKSETAAARIHHLKERLFPNRGLQERSNNFSELYLAKGEDFIPSLFDNLHFPSDQFYILSED
ncbi:MAG: bacillithiol biosynthesis cysteine-adding enzyme BshC [Vicingaceae bacterium]